MRLIFGAASRIKESSEPGRIHVSSDVADSLLAAGKEHWLEPRENVVVAKGKGILDTFWLLTEEDGFEDTERREDPSYTKPKRRDDEMVISKEGRPLSKLIDWNVETLLGLVKKIVAFRQKMKTRVKSTLPKASFGLQSSDHTFLDEVKEIIHLPHYKGIQLEDKDIQAVVISPEVVHEMRDLVETIALMYESNPFHNFEVSVASTVKVMAMDFSNKISIISMLRMSQCRSSNCCQGLSSRPIATRKWNAMVLHCTTVRMVSPRIHLLNSLAPLVH